MKALQRVLHLPDTDNGGLGQLGPSGLIPSWRRIPRLSSRRQGVDHPGVGGSDPRGSPSS